ncbi:MAG TPA: MFS transporter, partial [Chthoniobacterales bacterium]|nr:MFS transporter [Chthoniobacterales bacterium]
MGSNSFVNRIRRWSTPAGDDHQFSSTPQTMTKTSTWMALRNPVFRKLWIASVISGTCVAAHDTAATWLMNMLTPSPFLISVLATVASLPFFLFTLPAGALADIVDRKKFLCLINLWLAVAAAALAILGWLHLLNPYVILTSVFVIGVGFALNAPAWTSSVSEVVSNVELPSAGILGGLQLNISGIIGPALGGLLVPVIGLNFVFAVNAACFLVVILAVLQWKRTNAQSRIGLERFFESFTTAIRYVRYAPGLQVVLARNALFALFISVIPALMPVVGLKALHLNPSQLGLLFTSMGVGSVAGAVFIIPWLRARYSPNTLVVSANLVVVLVYVLMALVRQQELFLVVAALAGVGWTLSASELWVAAQRAMPGWARGRMNATVIMVSQGALALGGVIWGYAVATTGTTYTLLGAAVLFLISLALARPLSINFTGTLNFDPAPVTTFSHRLIYTPEPHDGPMSITVEFKVDCAHGREFINLMREVRLIHLRNGAYSWRLDEDITRPNTLRLEMIVPSWNEHLLQKERMTKAEKELLEKASSLHIGTTAPEERIYLSVNKDLF